MTNVIYQIIFIPLFLVFLGCSKAQYRMPVREIERPLCNPEGMKSVMPGFSSIWSLSPYKSDAEYKYLFMPKMSYAVSHNFELAALPFPYFQYQPVSSIRYDGEKFWLNGFNLAVSGGLSPASYFDGKSEFNPVTNLGILYKYPFNYYFWNEGNCGSSMTNLENLKTRFMTALGTQLSDQLSVKLGYAMIIDQPLEHPGIRYLHHVPLTMNFNTNRYFSFWLSAGPVAEQNQNNVFFSSAAVDLHW